MFSSSNLTIIWRLSCSILTVIKTVMSVERSKLFCGNVALISRTFWTPLLEWCWRFWTRMLPGNMNRIAVAVAILVGLTLLVIDSKLSERQFGEGAAPQHLVWVIGKKTVWLMRKLVEWCLSTMQCHPVCPNNAEQATARDDERVEPCEKWFRWFSQSFHNLSRNE